MKRIHMVISKGERHPIRLRIVMQHGMADEKLTTLEYETDSLVIEDEDGNSIEVIPTMLALADPEE